MLLPRLQLLQGDGLRPTELPAILLVLARDLHLLPVTCNDQIDDEPDVLGTASAEQHGKYYNKNSTIGMHVHVYA